MVEVEITKSLGVSTSSQATYIYTLKPETNGIFEFSLESLGGINLVRSDSPKLKVTP